MDTFYTVILPVAFKLYTFYPSMG